MNVFFWMLIAIAVISSFCIGFFLMRAISEFKIARLYRMWSVLEANYKARIERDTCEITDLILANSERLDARIDWFEPW